MITRKPIKNASSKRLFRKGYTKTETKNLLSRPMRGGIRL